MQSKNIVEEKERPSVPRNQYDEYTYSKTDTQDNTGITKYTSDYT
jgi:hypothetical protein